MRLDGRIEDFDLFEVLQSAMRRNAASRLLVADEQHEGYLDFRDGLIVSACWGDGFGEEAVFGLLSCSQGMFSWSANEEEKAEEGTLLWDWPTLLTVAFRRAALVAPKEESTLDEDDLELLERDLRILILNVEADIARLADDAEGPVALLEGLSEMLNMAVSLAPEQAKRLDFRLDSVLPRNGWKGSGASFFQLDGLLLDVRAISSVYEAAAFDETSRRSETKSAARMLTQSLGDVLQRLCQLVSSTASHRELGERSRTLGNDLRALVRTCEF